MTMRPIREIGDPVLRTPADPVRAFDKDLAALVRDLEDTVDHPGRAGVAATQIGVGLRAFVVDVTGHRKARSCHGELVLFDPEIVAAAGPVVAREGCLSVPHLTGDVARASSLIVRGITVDGNDRVVEVDAFEARAVLHEIDHLDGLLFLDRVASPESLFRRKVYQ